MFLNSSVVHMRILTLTRKFCFYSNLQAKKFRPFKSSSNKPRYWNLDPRVMDTDEWIHIQGKYKVFPWALSGVESSIVVAGDDFTVAFDMGYAHRHAVKCQHVFISHGHMDHISGVVSHASKRGLYNMPPATYYVPPHLVKPLTRLAETYSEINEDPITLKLRPVTVDDSIKLPGGILVKPFPTKHRVRSQGYLLYRVDKKLKTEYHGQASKTIGDLVREGKDIFDIREIPEVAYTGDTMSDIFDDPHNTDLLKVNLLITEATYVDNEDIGKDTVQKARERGHIHVDEIIKREKNFANVKDILLVHFSDKYSSRYIRKQIDEKLPPTMANKVHIGLICKEKFETKR